MTLQNLRLLCRAGVPGAKLIKVTNAVLDLVINNGVLDIATRTACMKTNAKFDVEADEDEYAMSVEVTDFLTIDKPGLWWNAGTGAATDWLRLRPRTLSSLDQKQAGWRDEDSDDPLYYTLDGDILTIYPIPDTDLTDGFHLYYGKKPAEMSATTHHAFSGTGVEYPRFSCFNDAIIAYVTWKLNPMLNKKQDANLSEVEYLRILQVAEGVFNKRLDISAREGRLQGRKIR